MENLDKALEAARAERDMHWKAKVETLKEELAAEKQANGRLKAAWHVFQREAEARERARQDFGHVVDFAGEIARLKAELDSAEEYGKHWHQIAYEREKELSTLTAERDAQPEPTDADE